MFKDHKFATVTAQMISQLEAQNGHSYIAIKKQNLEKQIVYAEVYAPMQIDTHGECMAAEDIELMAHRFLTLDLKSVIDTRHDNVPTDCYPVESFIARKGDPDFAEGAWVLAVHVPDEKLWASIKSGEINGFSFEALVRKHPAVVMMEVTIDNFVVLDMVEGHQHIAFVELNEDGVVIGGRTTTDDGHSHVIRRGTATELTDGHKHRIPL